MQQDTTSRNIRYLIIGGIIAIILIIVFAIINFTSQIGKIGIAVSVLPRDATITLNGESVTTDGRVFVPQGGYKVVIKKEGFTTFEQDFVASDINKSIIVSLAPESNEAKEWANQNQKLYLENEGKAGQASAAEGATFRDKNPIVNQLPFNNMLFTIGYRNDPSDPSGNSIIITINASPGNRQLAIYQIRQMGFDPADFKIEFNEYRNPFAS